MSKYTVKKRPQNGYCASGQNDNDCRFNRMYIDSFEGKWTIISPKLAWGSVARVEVFIDGHHNPTDEECFMLIAEDGKGLALMDAVSLSAKALGKEQQKEKTKEAYEAFLDTFQ